MLRYTLALGCLLAVVGGVSLHAQTARDVYLAALAREHAVRAAMDAGAPLSTLAEARSVVAAYREAVRQFPASGYSDNALWQAGRLLLDIFARSGQPQDRETGARLLRSIATNYPTSKLVKDVPGELAHVGLAGTADATAKPAPRLATIQQIRRTVLPDAIRVIIELDAEVAFHEEHLADPDRVFVDFSMTRAALPLLDQTIRFVGDNDIVRNIRIGRHPNSTTRVVVDAIGVSSYSVYPLYNPYRLVIDCVRGPSDTLLAARGIGSNWEPRLPSLLPRASAAIAAATVEPPPAPTTPKREPAKTAAAPTLPVTGSLPNYSTAGVSMARQLGLGVSRIVIDPGHGGHDPGAQGDGVNEAELVLDIALRVEKLFAKTPGIEIILTRRTDDYVPLQERTAIANREGADLFLSIHANASPMAQARGVETYFLNFATNMNAAGVAARENAASGQAMAALPDFVKAIALNNKLAESRDFANEVQRALVERLRGANKTVRNLGVKQAPFVVLIGAAMPSVLAEISFLTNAQESRLLRGNAYRQRIAEAFYNAIRTYQAELKNIKTVAHQ